jgi:hypothetical protein
MELRAVLRSLNAYTEDGEISTSLSVRKTFWNHKKELATTN